MNTKVEIQRLTLAICEGLDLSLEDVMDVQVDLAQEYLETLVKSGHLATPEDARLLTLVPEFWGWCRQRWANQDRWILDRVSKLDLLEWRTRGVDIKQVYYDYCQVLAHDYAYPNPVVMAAFKAEKQQQNHVYNTLKNLFQTT